MKQIILIQCKDQLGLVFTISKILADYQLNITVMREFVDEASNQFFVRIECHGLLNNQELLHTQLTNKLPLQAKITINPPRIKKVAILVTKEHHCLGDTLVRHFFNTLDAEICCIIGNYDHLKPFSEKFDIPFYHVSHIDVSKEEFENNILSRLKEFNPDYIILAKFMRILSKDFITHFPNRIINIHHSFLPAFVGANPYRKAFERGVKLIGATAHFVTDDLDEGPIIAQETIPVNHTFDVSQMVILGREIEKSVLNKAMQLVFQDRVFITENKTIVFE